MNDLAELYHEIILDHGKNPRNHGEMENADKSAEGYNPLCGDRITLYVKLNDGTISDISFKGQACAICTASASLMTESVKQSSVENANATFKEFHAMLTSKDDSANLDEFDRLSALGGVKKFPMRVKCATLPWHTLQAVLNDKEGMITTE